MLKLLVTLAALCTMPAFAMQGELSCADEILVLGNNAVDRIYYVAGAYNSTGKRVASDMRIYHGGQAANVACTLAPLAQQKVTYIGVFGNDSDAQASRASLERAGVNVEGLTIDCYSNNATIMVDAESGDRSVTFFPSVAMHLKTAPQYAPFLEALSARDMAHVKFIYSDCRIAELSETIFAQAVLADIPIVLDVEVVNEKTLKLIEYATYLITNDCVIQELAGEADLELALHILAKKYKMRGVVATLGSNGCIGLEKVGAEEAFEIKRQEGYQVAAVDTTGAGDAFHAGFIAALARKKSFLEALAFSNCVASEKCMVQGPRLGLAALEGIRKKL